METNAKKLEDGSYGCPKCEGKEMRMGMHLDAKDYYSTPTLALTAANRFMLNVNVMPKASCIGNKGGMLIDSTQNKS